MTATKRRVGEDTRSDMWISKDPDVYLAKLTALCRRELTQGWVSHDLTVAFAVGARLDRGKRETLAWLAAFCAEQIQLSLKKGETVCDHLFQIYNLATRGLENIVEQATPRQVSAWSLYDRVRWLVKHLDLNDAETMKEVQALLRSYPDAHLKASA